MIYGKILVEKYNLKLIFKVFIGNFRFIPEKFFFYKEILESKDKREK